MRILDFFYDGNHFFNNLITYPEWLSSTIQTEVETIALYDYGMRELRPYLEYLTTREDPNHIKPSIDAVVKSAVLSYVTKYSYKYDALFETETFDYNPIENYDMTEIMTNDTTETTYGKVSTLTKVKDSQDERTLDTTDETTPDLTDTHTLNSLTNTQTNEIAGFDSAGFNDADKKTDVGTGSETTTTTGTSTTTHSGTDTMAHTGTDTDTDTLSGKDSEVRNYTLTRSGNIGVTTSQQMVTSQREVADFSALAELAHGIINEITIGAY